eukprot:jgi/Psemu1/970/gm1.970_g
MEQKATFLMMFIKRGIKRRNNSRNTTLDAEGGAAEDDSVQDASAGADADADNNNNNNNNNSGKGKGKSKGKGKGNDADNNNNNNNSSSSGKGKGNDNTKKSVVWLPQELKLWHHPTSGNKAALASHLTKAIDRGIKEVHPDAIVVEEPKYNFTEVFDIPKFKALKTEYEFDRWENIRKDAAGIPITMCTPREKGCVDPEFQKKHELSSNSHPWEFAEVFLPLYNDAKDKNSSFSFEDMKNWTNWKASLPCAGEKIYKEFKPFESKELRQFVGLYVLHGLCPTAQPRRPGDTSDTNRVCNLFKRHKHFKAFLACQDPCVPTPPRKDIAVDEMTMGFKGQHIDKHQITHKREGDGFQADALCEDGYCYQMYMRNDPVPKKYLDMLGLSPLHSRTMWLFDSLKDDHHHVGMGNLYNSVMFCKAAYRHSKQVLCHGVACKANCGIPDRVFQQELKSIQAQRAARGTVKAAVLEGDPKCAFLIASSVYDTKPTDKKEKMKFLQLNQLDTYNNGMGNADISDQLRGVYRLDKWVRNQKWWWSVIFWAVGVLVTNAYKLYFSVCKEEGVSKDPCYKAHYNFRRAIGEYWVDPEAVEVEAEAQMFFIFSTADQFDHQSKVCKLRMTDLLNVSSVCGVGIDTVPIPGNTKVDELTLLLLEVVGLAQCWNKPLSCRVFPVPNKKVGEMTTFDSPYLSPASEMSYTSGIFAKAAQQVQHDDNDGEEFLQYCTSVFSSCGYSTQIVTEEKVFGFLFYQVY